MHIEPRAEPEISTHLPTDRAPRSPYFFLLLAVALIGTVDVALISAPRESLVSIRMLLFTTYVVDRDAPESRVDALLPRPSVVSDTPASIRAYLDSRTSSDLVEFAKDHPDDDTLLARQITLRISAGRPSRGCGSIEPLAAKIEGVAHQLGCCSDYVRAYLAYAELVGLDVREADNTDHSTIEYFDRAEHRWIWLDPALRVQAFDSAHHLLGQLSIKRDLLEGRSVSFTNLFDAVETNKSFDPTVYTPAAFRSVYWAPSKSLVSTEVFDAPLRRANVPRPVRQLAELLLGVRPGYLAMSDARFVRNHRIGQITAAAVLIGLLCVILGLLAAAARAGFRLRRHRTTDVSRLRVGQLDDSTAASSNASGD